MAAVALALGELAACSFITGVPGVDRVRVTAAQTSMPAEASGITIVGEAYDDDGGVITHRRRIVTFTSRTPSVATVSGSGVGTVIGIAPGTSWIVGESGGKRDSVLITVTAPVPRAIQISPAFPRVRVGGTTQVQVTPQGEGGRPFTSFTLGCTSSVPSVFTTEASGTGCAVRGVSLGTAVLRVTVNGTGVQDFTVVVEQEQYSRLTAITRPVLRETEVVPVAVRLFRGDGTEVSSAGRQFTYSSSNITVASVDGAGVLRAVGEGRATITVTGEGGVTSSFDVQVTKIPAVALLITSNPLYRVGATSGLRIEPLDSLNRVLSLVGRNVQVSVSDPSVLRISTSGLVTPLAPGNAAVTVRVDSITASTAARVTEVPIAVMRIDSTQVIRPAGATFQYTVTLIDSLGARATNRNVRWTSSNPRVVEINQTTGLARTLATGQSIIRAVLLQSDILARDFSDEASIIVEATVGLLAAQRPSPSR